MSDHEYRKIFGGSHPHFRRYAEQDHDERPKDWYCGRCSEVVPLGERCRICGATKKEGGVA